MTEEHIKQLMNTCNADINVPWNTLINRFQAQLAALSPQVSDDALSAMIEFGAACHRKAFAEFSASEQTHLALLKIREHALTLEKRPQSANPYLSLD